MAWTILKMAERTGPGSVRKDFMYAVPQNREPLFISPEAMVA